MGIIKLQTYLPNSGISPQVFTYIIPGIVLPNLEGNAKLMSQPRTQDPPLMGFSAGEERGYRATNVIH